MKAPSVNTENSFLTGTPSSLFLGLVQSDVVPLRADQFVRVSPWKAPGSTTPRGLFLAHPHGEGLAIGAGQRATLTMAVGRAVESGAAETPEGGLMLRRRLPSWVNAGERSPELQRGLKRKRRARPARLSGNVANAGFLVLKRICSSKPHFLLFRGEV